MENKKVVAPIIVLLCILTAMLVMAPRGLATAQTAATPATIYMTPDNGTSVQGLFNVTIMLSGSTTSNIGGANIRITFDDNSINATRWFVPTDDPTFFLPTTPVGPASFPTPPDPGYHRVAGISYIEVGVSKGGYPPTGPWGHTGLICIIEFNVTGGSQGQTILLRMNDPNSNTFLIDDTSATIPDVVINDGSYPIIPEFQVEYALPALIGLTVIAIAIRKKAFPKAVIKSL